MNEKENIVNNFSDLVNKIVVSYNKSFVLDFITTDSFELISDSMQQLQEQFNMIFAVFSEIQKKSLSTASNTELIDEVLEDVLLNSEKIQNNIHNRVEEIENASKNAQNAASAFEILKERTHEVEGMLSEIKDISTKTGILAINASIEAARAGQVGRGFRIIANEVRTLATNTGNSTKKIEEKLAELTGAVSEINKSMSLFISMFLKFQNAFMNILDAFDDNSTKLKKSGTFLSEISSSIKEQNSTIQDGVSSLGRINNSLSDTSTILNVVQTTRKHLSTLLQENE
ncbi:MAG: methyl-accepting chemotaxis protein [Treponemataceae bacterium]